MTIMSKYSLWISILIFFLFSCSHFKAIQPIRELVKTGNNKFRDSWRKRENAIFDKIQKRSLSVLYQIFSPQWSIWTWVYSWQYLSHFICHPGLYFHMFIGWMLNSEVNFTLWSNKIASCTHNHVYNFDSSNSAGNLPFESFLESFLRYEK